MDAIVKGTTAGIELLVNIIALLLVGLWIYNDVIAPIFGLPRLDN